MLSICFFYKFLWLLVSYILHTSIQKKCRIEKGTLFTINREVWIYICEGISPVNTLVPDNIFVYISTFCVYVYYQAFTMHSRCCDNLIISEIEFSSKHLEVWCSDIEFNNFRERLCAGQGLAVRITIVQNVFLQANLQ